MPLFAGFVTKFILFQAAADSGFLWLAAMGVTASFVSLYYYLTIVRQMYIERAEDPSPIRVPLLTLWVLGALFVGMIVLGVYPAPLMEAIQHASDALFSQDVFAHVATR